MASESPRVEVSAQEFQDALNALELYVLETRRKKLRGARVKAVLTTLRKEIEKKAPDDQSRGWQTRADITHHVFAFCQLSEWAGVWPDGLIDLLRLSMKIPNGFRISENGPIVEGLADPQKAAIEYLVSNRDASNGAVARHLRSMLSTKTTKTTVKRWLEQTQFQKLLQDARNAADSRAIRKTTKRPSPARRRPRQPAPPRLPKPAKRGR